MAPSSKCQFCTGKKLKKCVKATIGGVSGLYCLAHLEMSMAHFYGLDTNEEVEAAYAANGIPSPFTS